MHRLPTTQSHVQRLMLHADAAVRHEWAADFWERKGLPGLAKRERVQALAQRGFVSDMLAYVLRDPETT
jgi:hypothetical protein